ncbi:alkaline phosphatase PafA [Olivibacter domesticus]|uniref:Type I phosphodiesterase / nucleotide pyrophosphatase n=1 Tax=Olivibacter domesticus TaxID=407022 RepID=A0A1H7Y5L9_OLID1|nr:alkaline phosphatase PafA [Olivibacter domesticus]SEM41283.1 Type I phosphodiesterase / nucleotide pyrophosphatase [Olivibacter domesticus]
MIRLHVTIVSLLLILQTAYSQESKPLNRPKLVVGLMIDQMRWDYLYRYYDRYQEGGFKRLLNEGFSNENTYIDHLPTVTAIGHSCVYTGSVPSITGITGNEFIVRETGKNMYCAEDSTVQGVGTSGKGGQMSPKNLQASTITDELKLATNFRSKVIGIAFKDRSSIMPAGHFADAAYWFDSQANWITSSYYMQDLPKWVKKFNDEKRAVNYLKDGWNTLYPADSYVQSSPDDNPYEGPMKGTTRPILPVNAETLENNGARIIYSTPFGNAFALDFAKEAINQEQLGHNPANVPDFLAISLSSTDAIGHQYGVNALEVEDMYLRLDQDIAKFLQFLDEKVGHGEYTLFLTADHGASHNNPFYIDHKGSGGYVSDEVSKNLNKQILTKFGTDQVIQSLENDQVHLNHALIAQKGLNEETIRSFVVDYLRQVPGIAFAVDMDKVGSSSVPQPIRERIINSYNYKRSGVIQIIFDPQWKNGSPNQTGTGHSAWNPYDAHIPLLWMGWGIPAGSSNKVVSMCDIAPTLAAMLHIQEPNGNVGKPISFQKK